MCEKSRLKKDDVDLEGECVIFCCLFLCRVNFRVFLEWILIIHSTPTKNTPPQNDEAWAKITMKTFVQWDTLSTNF